MAVKRTNKVHSIFDANTIFYAFERRDYKRCVTLAMNVLYDSAFPQLDDSLVDQVFLALIKSYIALGCDEDAIFQIKAAIAVGVSNDELSVLGMECLLRVGRLDAHRYFNYSNLDFINDQSDDFDDDDDEDDFDDEDDDDNDADFAQELSWRKTIMSATIMESLNGDSENAIDHEFLSPIDRNDTLMRMLTTYDELVTVKDYENANNLLDKMFAKFGNNTKMLEMIIASNSTHNYQGNNYEYSKILMTQQPLSPIGLYGYLMFSRENNCQPDWDLIQDSLKDYRAANAKNIADIAIALITEGERYDLVQMILDNNQALSAQAEYIFVRSYLLCNAGDKVGAVNLLKGMRAMFGRRSFAQEYLSALKQGKLQIGDVAGVPECILVEYSLNVENEINEGKANFSSQILEDLTLRHQLCVLLMTSNVGYCERLLKHMNKRALESLVWDIQMLILDDEKVKADIKSLLLYTLMNNFNNMYVYVSSYDCIEIADFSKIAEENQNKPLVIRHASNIAVSKIYFSEVTMLTRLENAVKLVEQFYSANPEFKDKKILAELILVECWYYEMMYDINKIANSAKIKKEKLVKYHHAYKEYCKDNHLDNSITSENYDYSTTMGLEEILGDMSSKIDTILGGNKENDMLFESIMNKHNSLADEDFEKIQADKDQVIIDAFAGDKKAQTHLLIEKMIEGNYGDLDIKSKRGKDGKRHRATIVPFEPKQTKDDKSVGDDDDSRK